MTKKITIVSIVILIVILAGFTFWHQYAQRSKANIPPIVATSTLIQPITTTTTLSIAAQTDEHLGMKRYRNEEWGFEFWYPEGWEVKDKTSSAPQNVLYLSTNFPNDNTLTMDSFSISIVTAQFADYAAQGEKISQIIVSGTVGRTYRYALEGISSIIIDLPLHEKKMLISAQKQHEKELSKVLSTFKFLK